MEVCLLLPTCMWPLGMLCVSVGDDWRCWSGGSLCKPVCDLLARLEATSRYGKMFACLLAGKQTSKKSRRWMTNHREKSSAMEKCRQLFNGWSSVSWGDLMVWLLVGELVVFVVRGRGFVSRVPLRCRCLGDCGCCVIWGLVGSIVSLEGFLLCESCVVGLYQFLSSFWWIN